jgi:SMODS and SLOG-associating 2TM effector domain 1/Protein of unknown function (DUF4231)
MATAGRGSDVVEMIMEAQRRWSRAASRAKREIDRWRKLSLGLTISGALLVTAASQAKALGSGVVLSLSIAGGLALAAAPIVSSERLGGTSISDWARMRSVSEGLKSEAYLYLTHTSPYHQDDRDQRLLAEVERITVDASDLASRAESIEPGEVSVPAVHDAETYAAVRLASQIDSEDGYYPRSMARERRGLDRAKWARLVLSLLAAALGVVAGATENASLAAWVPVITTAAAAIVADAAARRYEENLLEYSRTLIRLRTKLQQWRTERPKAADLTTLDQTFVRGCEDAISTENKSWMAGYSTPGSGAGAQAIAPTPGA